MEDILLALLVGVSVAALSALVFALTWFIVLRRLQSTGHSGSTDCQTLSCHNDPDRCRHEYCEISDCENRSDKPMDHKVFQSNGLLFYGPADPTNCLHTNTPFGKNHASQSELSSFTSDDEKQEVSKRRGAPRIDLCLVYQPALRVLHVKVQHATVRRSHRRPLLLRCSVLGRRLQMSLPCDNENIDGARCTFKFEEVERGWLLQGRLSCQLFGRAGSCRAERLLAEGSIRLCQLELAERGAGSCRLVLHRSSRRLYLPLQFLEEPQLSDRPARSEIGIGHPETADQSPEAMMVIGTMLSYESINSKMILLVTRIEGLPKHNQLMKSEYFMRVSLVKQGSIEVSCESRHVPLHCNQIDEEYHFTVARTQMAVCWLLCELILIRRYSKDRCIGLCQIGTETTQSATQQWLQCINNSRTAPVIAQHRLFSPHALK